MLEALMVEACLIRVILTPLIINLPRSLDLGPPCSPASFSDVLRVTSAVASFIYRLFRSATLFPRGMVSTWTNTLSDFNDVCGHG
ncbi:hypothetical protein ASPBRDRAFT_601265 [Aspergillus brasiliensis CBS 101740]|uniref:Uncharacterized protein n=1 Tax=Aspergillus brasiliensis (strain CBS 101740 / IMI 381727 / IBT 21946) TaxID=767769 RepID=A0A1L9UH82_ASPBC|nr:hypothetical protein ASPBRDRAFT_601265 [Aspergillus brasiliensis CBS 101740]